MQTITHSSFESWCSKLIEFDTQEETDIYQCDEPKQLLLGFTVLPNQETHYIKLTDIERKSAAQSKAAMTYIQTVIDSVNLIPQSP
jgi:hypothetical protein